MSDQASAPSSQGGQGDPLLTVVIPTRNEAANIAPLLERLTTALAGTDYEAVFIDDSDDDTAAVVRTKQAVYGPSIRLIHRPRAKRDGLSGAVVEGMRVARGEWICVIDADLQHPPELIGSLLERATRSGADLVAASRRANALGPVGLSRRRALTSQILTILARMLFPRVLKNTSDPLTGYFLVRRAVVEPDRLHPDGFKILLETLVRHPELRVTELYFDFAPRHDGQSKADVREGLRFFRHLVRLRFSVNQHLVRFIALLTAAIALNLVLLGLLIYRVGWADLPAAALTGVATLWFILVGRTWVFSDRAGDRRDRSPARFALLGLAFLIAIYLPLTALMNRAGIPLLLASLLAMGAGGFVYYLLSEHWIWSRGLTMRPREMYFYRIHDIVRVASQIPLPDLAHFQTPDEPGSVDMLVRVDRHGMPSPASGSIAYSERFGRLGFGVTVAPGDYTEVIVSPLLETAPAFVYNNVVEPVLRWQFVRQGYALVKAAAVAHKRADGPSLAVLIAGSEETAVDLIEACQSYGLGYMGDDAILLDGDGIVHAFPTTITINRALLEQASAATRAVAPVQLQRLVYTPAVRRFGLRLAARGVPVATLNTYLQRLIPQPKYPLGELAQTVRFADVAQASTIVIGRDVVAAGAMPSAGEVAALLQTSRRADAAFLPAPYLVDQLSQQGAADWLAAERHIIASGLASCAVVAGNAGVSSWLSQLVTARDQDTITVGHTPEKPSARSLPVG